MFQVTVVNLNRDATTVVEGGGSVSLGTLSPAELMTLLDSFVEVDAVQNMKFDPEIRVQNRRDRFVIRTGQRKLFLQDARNLAEPAYVLSPAEIIAELDGSAAARRTTPPIPFTMGSDESPNATQGDSPALSSSAPAVKERRPPYVLMALILLLGGYIAYSEWAASRGGSITPALAPLTNSERLAEDSSLTGVYTTGSEPGQHGIIVLGDGKLKLFQVNAQAAPSVVPASYRYGRIGSNLYLATDQPGGLIKVLDRELLEFCAETYRRVP